MKVYGVGKCKERDWWPWIKHASGKYFSGADEVTIVRWIKAQREYYTGTFAEEMAVNNLDHELLLFCGLSKFIHPGPYTMDFQDN